MVRIAPVNLPYNPKTLWFDAGELELHAGCDVVVQTARGTEFGHMPEPAFEATSDQVKKLKTPLKPVLRVADDEDRAKQAELEARAAEALPVFKELAAKASEEMRPVSVEYLFDGDKAVFYFESENRVDFRELVRTLSSRLHVRVDMRQIGVRDEARMVGGLGHCGQELCCKRLGGEFCPVSIRMAKEQDLPLNPTKISGLCGRLMCCLRYEYEAYKDFKGRAPKKNALIDTPAGMGKVVEFDTPRETVRLRMEDGSSLTLPVSALDTGDKVPREGERIRPCHISQENFDKIMEELSNDSNLAMMGEKLFSDDPDLADTTVEGGSIERVHRRRRSSGDASHRQSGDSGRKPRKRGTSSPAPQPRDERKRRRSVSATDGTEIKHEDSARKEQQDRKDGQSAGGNANRSRNRRRRGGNGGNKSRQGNQNAPSKEGSQGKGQAPSRPRPGQHSSTVSGDAPKGNGTGGSGNSRNRRRRRGGGHGQGSGQPNNGAARE